jgi:hypothetical protein
MTPAVPDLLAWTAASCTWLAFVHPGRRVSSGLALAANLSFIAYGCCAALWPVLLLHLAMAPINLWRLAAWGLAGARATDEQANPLRPSRRRWIHPARPAADRCAPARGGT